MSKQGLIWGGILLLACLLAAVPADARIVNLEMDVAPRNPRVGDLVTVTVIAANDGVCGPAGDVSVPLPPGLQYVGHTPGRQYQGGIWRICDSAPHASTTLHIQARLTTSQVISLAPATLIGDRSVQSTGVMIAAPGCRACPTDKYVCCVEADDLKHACGPVPCYRSQDACIVIRMPPMETSRPVLTHDGAYALTNVFHAAATRAVENVMIRVANSTKVCPDGKNCKFPCDWTLASVGEKQIVHAPDGGAFDLSTGAQVDPNTGQKHPHPTAKLVWKNGQIFKGDADGKHLVPIQ